MIVGQFIEILEPVVKLSVNKYEVRFHVEGFKDWLEELGIRKYKVEKAVTEMEDVLSLMDFKETELVYTGETPLEREFVYVKEYKDRELRTVLEDVVRIYTKILELFEKYL